MKWKNKNKIEKREGVSKMCGDSVDAGYKIYSRIADSTNPQLLSWAETKANIKQ